MVINHLGTPKLHDLQNEEYWNGLGKFAALHENIYMKLSFLCNIQKNWDEDEFIISCVLRVIMVFGVDRCFFASNFPVD